MGKIFKEILFPAVSGIAGAVVGFAIAGPAGAAAGAAFCVAECVRRGGNAVVVGGQVNIPAPQHRDINRNIFEATQDIAEISNMMPNAVENVENDVPKKSWFELYNIASGNDDRGRFEIKEDDSLELKTLKIHANNMLGDCEDGGSSVGGGPVNVGIGAGTDLLITIKKIKQLEEQQKLKPKVHPCPQCGGSGRNDRSNDKMCVGCSGRGSVSI